MTIIVQFWGDRTNPMGYPAGYPADRMDIEDGEQIPIGWTEVTDKDYRNAIEDYQDDVVAINKLADDQQSAQEAVVESQMKAELDTLQVHKETADAGSLTRDDRDDAIETLVSLMLKYAPVLEQLRKTPL